MTPARMIARAAMALRDADLPEDVAAAARLHFLDAVGVGLAASRVPQNAGWADALASAGGTGSATVLGQATGAPPAMAAMLNGARIHALEYDDTHIASVVHGSAVAAPAALAAAEAAGVEGDALLKGYALAWEVMIRMGLAAPGAMQARGFQVTAVAGAIGAATAASLIGGLDEERTVSAIGIAGSQASGLLEFLSVGASVKALHPGWAAHTGLVAAALATGGMTGPDSILDGRFGVMAGFAGMADAGAVLEAQMASLGTPWHLPQAAFKAWPCCHYIHPFLEALETLIAQGLTAENLAHATAFVPPPAAPLICEPWARRQAPANGYDAKWALAWCLAARLVRGRLGVADFIADPDPQSVALARRFEWAPLSDHGFPARFAARLQVTLQDGRSLQADVANVRGAPDRPFAAADVQAKFRANAAAALPLQAVVDAEAAIMALDRPGSLPALRRALAG
ncbi:MAG TPA: MmgE/PrpD family protein [Paracoccaceae bacterium]|nr:MmgE/PrpD family protein [Paracoccaceae bacterium]